MNNRKISGDLSLIKKLNKHAVLSLIKSSGPISRSDIAKHTKLNKATISTLVDELLQIKLIKEIGTGQSTGGRRPILVVFNDDAGSIIGVNFQINNISIILTNLNASTIWSKKVTIKSGQPKDILSQMKDLIHEAIQTAPETPLGILGIGVGVPGIVDHQKGEILIVPNLNWHNVPIKEYFKTEFRLPIFIDNEANATSLAEMMYGNGKGYDNLVYISAGIGIGVGLILNGKQYRGALGYSGEFGHMSIERNGLKCPCGNQGCWEMYASEKYFMSQIKQAGDFSNQTFSDFITSEMMSSDLVLVNLNKVGINLGIGITNIINALNPDIVIIGNTLSEAGDSILNPIRNTVQKRRINSYDQNAEIKLTGLNDKPPALGAATIVLSHLINDHTSPLINL